MNRKRMRAIERHLARFNEDGGQGGPGGDAALRARSALEREPNHEQIPGTKEIHESERTPPETGKDRPTFLQWTLLGLAAVAFVYWAVVA